ncbi:DNA methyltransferase [Actinomycetes bacterium KLBMP 9759]
MTAPAAQNRRDATRRAIGAIWPTAQHSPASQRRERYLTESMAHPAKMLPAVAAEAIRRYTAPGDVVLDPMCGIGTTLVEATHLGRRAIGIEYEPRWADIARANLTHAGATSSAVITGDARQLDQLLPTELEGQVALVVTSPPYGHATHGRVSTHPNGVRKTDYRYTTHRGGYGRGNLAYVGNDRLLDGFTRILTNTHRLLRPGGHVVITVRPWRDHIELIDGPSRIAACAHAAGLTLVDRCVALLGRITDTGDYVPRPSFFHRDFITRQRARGVPLHLVAHEDVLIFRVEQEQRPCRQEGLSLHERTQTATPNR